MMSDLPGLTAGPLVVTLPLYQLPLPSHNVQAMTVSFAGSVECQPVPVQQAQVSVMAQLQIGSTTLKTVSVNVPHPSSALGGTAWDGLLLPFSGVANLTTDAYGNLMGPGGGDSGQPHPQVFIEVQERSGISDPQSLSIGW